MLLKLYQDTNDDVGKLQKQIIEFYHESNKLKEKYIEDSHRYAQYIHSITGYLFLYNPDSIYMYKASIIKQRIQCKTATKSRVLQN